MIRDNLLPKIKSFSSLALLFLVLVFSMVPTTTIFAQQPTPSDDQVNAIARQLFCPVCENTPLDVCPTQACHDWRELIRQMLAEGKTPFEIKQYFVDHYGARVLAEPPQTGFNWLVYVVPPVAFIVGTLLLVIAFRTWKTSSKKTTAEIETGSVTSLGNDAYTNRIEEELRKRE